MDKFGIFGLISSLLGENNGVRDQNRQAESSDFSSSFQSTDESQAAKQRANLPPLQNSMIITMKNHDEFIKRVKAKQNKK